MDVVVVVLVVVSGMLVCLNTSLLEFKGEHHRSRIKVTGGNCCYI